jgi:hypothetical protein
MSAPTARLRDGQWYGTYELPRLSLRIPADGPIKAIREVKELYAAAVSEDPTGGVERGSAASLNDWQAIWAAVKERHPS